MMNRILCWLGYHNFVPPPELDTPLALYWRPDLCLCTRCGLAKEPR